MKASDWISVKDKLPKTNERVLVCCQDGEQQRIEFATLKSEYFNRLTWYNVYEDFLNTVTHWQKIILPKK